MNKDRKETAWFYSQVIENDDIGFMRKLLLFFKYCYREALLQHKGKLK